MLRPHQVSKARPALTVGGGCCGNGPDDPPSPHRFPGCGSIGPFYSVCRPAQADHDVGSGPDQRGLSDSKVLHSGSRLRCGGDREGLGLLL